jgi:hypothetical protein
MPNLLRMLFRASLPIEIIPRRRTEKDGYLEVLG